MRMALQQQYHFLIQQSAGVSTFLYKVFPAAWWVLFSAILVFHPAVWLFQTWQDGSYETSGGWVALFALVLWALSLCSPVGQFVELSTVFKPLASMPVSGKANWRHWLGLAVFSTGCRVLSQVMAVHILGALALVVDVYVLAQLTQVHRRMRPLSPFWLAMLFAWSLPVGHLLQRTGGYVLQWFSAQGAGAFLSLSGAVAQVSGTELVWHGQHILVDPPCAGASSFLMALMAWTAMCAIFRPRFPQAMAGLGLTLTGALFANVLRIVVLTVSQVFVLPGIPADWNLMQEPGHSVVGLVAFCVCVLLPLKYWSEALSWQPPLEKVPSYTVFRFRRRLNGLVEACSNALYQLFVVLGFTKHPHLSGMLACFVALLVVQLPHQPVDVSRAVSAVTLPAVMSGVQAVRVPLSSVESRYFQQYGGQALKARYGQTSVMVVQTASPLRHLHDPGDCLRGLGFDVQFEGRYAQPYPTNRYVATAPSGEKWFVDVVFRSSQGQVVTTVSEAILLWTQSPHTEWMAVQRIRPAVQSTEALAQDARLASELSRVLDLTPVVQHSSVEQTLQSVLPAESSLAHARYQDVLPKDVSYRQFKEAFYDP